jgi:hypothetical protein
LPEEQCSSVSNDPAGWSDLVEQLGSASLHPHTSFTLET